MSISPAASFDGKNPGATVFEVIFRGPSSMARFRARWWAAALDTEYMIVPCSPIWGTLMPAVELTIMILEGSEGVAPAVSSGTILDRVSTLCVQLELCLLQLTAWQD